MKKLTTKQKIEALQNALEYYNFDKKYFIHPSDTRIGNKFALAYKGDTGTLNIESNFLTYEEFNAFLLGYGISKREAKKEQQAKRIYVISADSDILDQDFTQISEDEIKRESKSSYTINGFISAFNDSDISDQDFIYLI